MGTNKFKGWEVVGGCEEDEGVVNSSCCPLYDGSYFSSFNASAIKNSFMKMKF